MENQKALNFLKLQFIDSCCNQLYGKQHMNHSKTMRKTIRKNYVKNPKNIIIQNVRNQLISS